MYYMMFFMLLGFALLASTEATIPRHEDNVGSSIQIRLDNLLELKRKKRDLLGWNRALNTIHTQDSNRKNKIDTPLLDQYMSNSSLQKQYKLFLIRRHRS